MEHGNDTTDGDLLKRAERNPEAFDALYQRHARSIHRWLHGQLGDGDRAWELTGEVFAQAWMSRKRCQPDENGSAAPWLHGIAKNVWRQCLRRQRLEVAGMRRLRMQVNLATPEDQDERLEQMAIEAMGPALRSSMDRLPPDQRIAIEMRIIDELPYDVIADRLDCSSTTVRMRVMRGLQTLNLDLRGGLS